MDNSDEKKRHWPVNAGDLLRSLKGEKNRGIIKEGVDRLSIPELRNTCRINSQLIGGEKPELVDRVVDGILYGALPICPTCGVGKMKKQGIYFVCPGYYDDDCFRSCGFKTTNIVRPEWIFK